MALIDRMKKYFEKGGFKVKQDSFGDKSCSWLSITHKTNKKYHFDIQFDYKGTVITSMDMYRKGIESVLNYFKNRDKIQKGYIE